MTRIAQISLLALLFAAGSARAAVLEVPGQFSSIATAVQFAQPGDTIRVQANFINSTEIIDLQGKAITIESTSSFQFNDGLILLADGTRSSA